jgi:ankyrin repeat protein
MSRSREAAASSNVISLKEIILNGSIAKPLGLTLIQEASVEDFLYKEEYEEDNLLSLSIQKCTDKDILLAIIDKVGIDLVTDMVDEIDEGATLLHIAASAGNDAAIEMLVDCGIPINSLNDYEETPTTSALECNELDSALLLVRMGGHVSIADLYKIIKLTSIELQRNFSKFFYYETMVEELTRDFGFFDVNARDLIIAAGDRSASDHHLAVLLDVKEVIEKVNHLQNINHIADDKGDTLLHYAARYDKITSAWHLLSMGADSRVSNNNGDNVLHIAAKYGHSKFIGLIAPEIRNYLFKSLNNDDKSVLDIALKYNNLEFASCLFNCGVTAEKFSYLHYSAIMQDQGSLEILMRQSHNIYQEDDNCFLPIHYAAMSGNIPMARLMLEEARFDNVNTIKHVGEDGVTPFVLATASRNPEMVNLFFDEIIELQKAKGLIDKEISTLEAASASDLGERLASLKELSDNLDIGQIDIFNNRDIYGATPLMHAAAMGDMELIEKLILYGADPTMTDLEGFDAAKYAISNGHGEAVEYLSQLSEEIKISTKIKVSETFQAASNPIKIAEDPMVPDHTDIAELHLASLKNDKDPGVHFTPKKTGIAFVPLASGPTRPTQDFTSRFRA